MSDANSRFLFATAPVSWGVQDYRDPSWEQPYAAMLDEMAACGYSGTELGPYGFFPTDPDVLRPVLKSKGLRMLSSFVPVNLADSNASKAVIEHIRQVGALLAALEAPCIVLADEQSRARENVAGRVPSNGSHSLNAQQWQNVAAVLREAERVAADYGLDLVFHPHVGTYIETPAETERFFDAVSATRTGLCLDTGHCRYAGGDPVREAKKYRNLLRYVHIKDIDRAVLEDSLRREWNFEQAVEAGVFSAIGEGCLDFPAFFSTLMANGYSGWCVVEQDIKFGVSPVAPKESMGASLQYLRGVLHELTPA